MKKISFIIFAIIFTSTLALADYRVTRGPDIGEIYFIGPTVTEPTAIYHSTDFGETVTCVDSVSEVESICDHLLNGGDNNILDNSLGCNSEEEILLACNPVGVSEITSKKPFSIYPNPVSKDLYITSPSNLSSIPLRAIADIAPEWHEGQIDSWLVNPYQRKRRNLLGT